MLDSGNTVHQLSRPPARGLAACLLCSLALHGAVLLPFFWWPSPERSVAAALSVSPGLMLEIGSVAAPAGAPEESPAPPQASNTTAPATPAVAPSSTAVAAVAPPAMPPAMHERYHLVQDNLAVSPPDLSWLSTRAAVELDIPRPAPPPPRRALSPDEQQMLAEQIEQWSENPQQLLAEDAVLEWTFEGRLYRARGQLLSADSATDRDRVVVELVTEHEGEQWSSSVELTRLAFSHYAQFINRWDPDVFLSQDEVSGRFHSNTAVNISTDRRYRPRFDGPVTIAAVQQQAISLSRQGVFAAGVETRVSAMPLPNGEQPFDLQPAADSMVHHFDSDSRIRFHADGRYSWHAADGVEQWGTLGSEPAFLLAQSGVELTIEGTVAGQVLVFAPRRIIVSGDLRLARDPRQQPHSTDLLSVISGHTIQIAEPSITGPGDLVIEAGLFARQRFSVRNFRQRGDGAVLAVYGSLVAGSVSATEPRYGTRVEFDPRFDHLRPPGFPMTSRHALTAQDGYWQLVAHQP